MGVGGGNPAAVSGPELLAAHHETAAFTCGEAMLDDWLRRRALANQVSGVSRSYVITNEAAIVGYYTLAAGAIALAEAPGRLRRNMPDPIPMVVLGRLAIDRSHQGFGLGRALLRDAVRRTCGAADTIGIRGMLVHALSPAAKRFYESCGFLESPNNPMTLVIALKDASAALDAG